MIQNEARLEVIVGTMFAGKSTELIRQATEYSRQGTKVQLFKPSIDQRYSQDHLATHDGRRLPALNVASVTEMLEKTSPDTEVIGIDEVQFFESSVISAGKEYVKQGRIVLAAGLLKDFRDEYFPFRDGIKTMSDLLKAADITTILTAICDAENEAGEICGNDASRVQRFIDGKIAPYDSPVVQVGGKESYAPRCRQHYQFYPK